MAPWCHVLFGRRPSPLLGWQLFCRFAAWCNGLLALPFPLSSPMLIAVREQGSNSAELAFRSAREAHSYRAASRQSFHLQSSICLLIHSVSSLQPNAPVRWCSRPRFARCFLMAATSSCSISNRGRYLIGKCYAFSFVTG